MQRPLLEQERPQTIEIDPPAHQGANSHRRFEPYKKKALAAGLSPIVFPMGRTHYITKTTKQQQYDTKFPQRRLSMYDAAVTRGRSRTSVDSRTTSEAGCNLAREAADQYLKHREQASDERVKMAARSTHTLAVFASLTADGEFSPKELSPEKCKNSQEQEEKDQKRDDGLNTVDE